MEIAVMKKELAMVLESLEGFPHPKIKLEQYVTPPSLAAEMAVNAKLIDEPRLVYDLGCGTGMLAIAASLLGMDAVGFDIDIEALKVARKNAKKVGVYVDFVACRVSDVSVKVRAVTIMNPPFGIQRRKADRPFLEKAMEISDTIYSVHSAGSEPFIRRLCEEKRFEITHLWRYSIPLKRTYSFHEKEFKHIAVEVYRLRRC
ncbi:ribosomal L11 methyltransferase [Archaeoglobus veneficus SNP6]|uniref:Ribosomal L11 methyltransferase n=2 Tax=Archaeoglobus veneficus TaxID=58290 RepID=F2KQH0_ARCVS|nr:ribosomal L11 methyltransferase [Archaeoglobus veneficus SNP6]